MLIWALAVTSVPPVDMTSQLDEGILCVFALQPSKVPSRGDLLMSAAVTSLTIGTEMFAFVFDK